MELSRREFVGKAAAAMAVGGRVPGPTTAKGWLHKPLVRPGTISDAVNGKTSLRVHAAARGLLFGCAVDTDLLGKDEAYTRLVQEQANIVVAENAMKMGPMRPAVDRYEFAGGDRLVAFAGANGMKVRGHNLCWHRQLPDWFAGYATKENARGLLVDHIKTAAGHYKGKIHSWDVVNEAVHLPDGRADGLRESPWLKLIGPEYVEVAFRTAREIDPKALLTYNDYGIEGEEEDAAKKRAAVLGLLQGLKAKGLVDAVGVQGHVGAGEGFGAGVPTFVRTAGAMGLQVYVTEMDVNDRNLPPDNAVRDTAVAKTYGDFLHAVLSEQATKAVLLWGITDAHTWLNGEDARADHLPERCLPFDAEMRPKEAFEAVRKAMDARA